ncbi:DUF2334 domain-containing protein [Clostridium sardiniense]|uniref:DUF2334 domain-containing protein n=1 Tax=Clostridium sardiniense TaxID=29369 RepID=UPI003D337D0F
MKNKKLKKGLIYSAIAIFVILIGYGIAFYFSFFQGDTYVKNGQVESKITPENYESIYTQSIIKNGETESKLTHKDYNGIYPQSDTLDNIKLSKVNDVKISILGKEVPKDIQVLLRSQRYYLPLDYVTKIFGYTSTKENPLNFEKKDSKIIFSEKEAIINGKKYDLRGWLPKYENQYYISISDIEYIFSLTAVFDFKDNSVKLLKSNYNRATNGIAPLKDGKAALIRLEDFSAGGALYTDINQTKLKAMGDYLYSNGIRFHVAWVPRYKEPDINFDNDLLTNQCINNVGFVNLLDYMINSGAEIGLHGYTHQAGDSTSLSGIELSSKFNPTEQETKTVIESALKNANELNIPVYFFESPHYQATRKQKDVIQEYFKYLYEPYSVLYYTALKETDKGNVYIPTPLSYVQNHDTKPMIKNIENPRPDMLASLFYHPTLELDYITVSDANNTFTEKFADNSLIKSIVNALNKNGYSTINVTDIK